jgi:hypothetical protein
MKLKFIAKLNKTIILIHLVFISTLLISCKNEKNKEEFKNKRPEKNYPSINNFLFFKKGMTYDEIIRELKSRKISFNENPEDQVRDDIFWPSKEYYELLGSDCKMKMIQCFSLNILHNQIPYVHLYFVNNNIVRLYYYSEDSIINSPKSLGNLKLLRELFWGLKEKYGNPYINYKEGKIDTTNYIYKSSDDYKPTSDKCYWISKNNGINIELDYYENKRIPYNSETIDSSKDQVTSSIINVFFDKNIIKKVRSRYNAIIDNEIKIEKKKKVKTRKKELIDL